MQLLVRMVSSTALFFFPPLLGKLLFKPLSCLLSFLLLYVVMHTSVKQLFNIIFKSSLQPLGLDEFDRNTVIIVRYVTLLNGASCVCRWFETDRKV